MVKLGYTSSLNKLMSGLYNSQHRKYVIYYLALHPRSNHLVLVSFQMS